MTFIRDHGSPASLASRAALVFWLSAQPFIISAETASNVTLWDTGSRAGLTGTPEDRSAWKKVPTDLLLLEANPAKASSDPGYYGRDYVFKGDAVVENQKLMAVFRAAAGRMTLYSKRSGSAESDTTGSAGGNALILELSPSTVNGSSSEAHFEVVRNAADEVVLRVIFADQEQGGGVFGFGRNEIVEIKPSKTLKSFTFIAPLEYAILPSFIGDDLIYGTQENAAGDTLNLPNENMLLGLLKGEQTQFVMTWPKGRQQLHLGLGEESNGKRPIASIQFSNDGQSFYVAPMTAPGIWHKEILSPSSLEKDVAIGWKKPFPARWKTELYEEALKTSFAFRQTKGDIWRGVPGSYDYPVWFDGDQAYYHLGKKVLPKGDSIIYFLEGQGTPADIQTPADILKSTLGRDMANTLLDVEGRKLRTHHRRGGDGVHRACTCGCTEAIQAIFEAGDEVVQKDDIKGDLEDMMYFVHHHVDRINEYHRFAEEMIRDLEARKSTSPELGEYIDGLEQTISQIPQQCSVQQENMKSFSYADELVKRTMALTEKKDANNLKAYMDLLKDWRAMGGAQDYVLAQCHIITRKLAQDAGYNCAGQPKAVTLAEEIRARARQCLRNPDGYEIWADY